MKTPIEIPTKAIEPAHPIKHDDPAMPVKKKLEKVAQTEHHAYDADGGYVGIVIASAKQLAEMGLTAGPAPTVDMEAVKADGALQVSHIHASLLREFSIAGYSDEESKTFPRQLEWARGFLDDGNLVHGNLLGMDPAMDATAMADKIIAKNAALDVAISAANLAKSDALAAIDLASTPEDVAAAVSALIDVGIAV